MRWTGGRALQDGTGDRLTIEMHQLIVKVWEHEELPEDWKLGVNHPVYNKGLPSQSLILPTKSCPRSCSADLRPLLQILSTATKRVCWRQIHH